MIFYSTYLIGNAPGWCSASRRFDHRMISPEEQITCGVGFEKLCDAILHLAPRWMKQLLPCSTCAYSSQFKSVSAYTLRKISLELTLAADLTLGILNGTNDYVRNVLLFGMFILPGVKKFSTPKFFGLPVRKELTNFGQIYVRHS
jgi:hypothetical protein